MGRRTQKIKGALVKMGRRRRPGLGIIIETTDKPPKEMSVDEKKETRYKKLDLDYQASYSKEVCALVHWFERPSEWENTQTWDNRIWVPLTWLRIVKKKKEEKNEQ